MAKKLIFTSIIFLILIAISGVVSIRETTRMGSWQLKQKAEKIEQGGLVYAENCATCHGEHAKAEQCFMPQVGQIACSGRPLNTSELLCGEHSQRLEAVGWQGSTEEYIHAITTVGNSPQGMPAFDIAYRYDTFTALTEYQIDDVTAYILNFEQFPCVPPSTPVQKEWAETVAELPLGDATSGEELYNITYGCSACHGDLRVEGSNAVASWGGIFKDLDSRLDGYTAADYVYESILLPNAHVSPNCSQGPCSAPSAMPDNFGQRLSPQEMADLLAYFGIDTQVSNGIEPIKQ